MKNQDVIQEFYTVYNRNDLTATLQLFGPQILRTEFLDTPAGGTFRGLQEMAAHLEAGRSTWAEGGCEPEKFWSAGEKTVVLVHVRVRLKGKTDWIDGYVADAYVVRNGKIDEMHSYSKLEQALAWAGIKGDI